MTQATDKQLADTARLFGYDTVANLTVALNVAHVFKGIGSVRLQTPISEVPSIEVDHSEILIEHGGRPSLCCRCLVKKGTLKFLGFHYCPADCPCLSCSKSRR